MSKRLEMLEEMIAKGSNEPFVFYARAMELRGLDRNDEASAAYAEVADRFPQYVPTYLMAGQVAEALGQPDRAREWYERGLKIASASDAHAASELQTALQQLASGNEADS